MFNKIVILGNTGIDARITYSWFCRTVADGMLQNEYEVLSYDYKTHTIDQIHKFLKESCDSKTIVFTHLTMHNHKDKFMVMDVFSDIRKKTSAKFVHSMQDVKTKLRYSGDISHAFDMALVGHTEKIEEWSKSWNVPTYFWPYSAITQEKIGTYKQELDFGMPVFPGNPNSHEDRSEFLRKLQSVMKIKIIKTKSSEDVRDRTVDFAVSSKCILGLCTGYTTSRHFLEVRPFQYGGAGAVMIIRKFKGMDDIIPENLYYPINGYDVEDAKQVKDHWKHIQKMDLSKLKEQIFSFIQTYHSSKVRMKQTVEILEGKREKLDIFLKDIDIPDKYWIDYR